MDPNEEPPNWSAWAVWIALIQLALDAIALTRR